MNKKKLIFIASISVILIFLFSYLKKNLSEKQKIHEKREKKEIVPKKQSMPLEIIQKKKEEEKRVKNNKNHVLFKKVIDNLKKLQNENEKLDIKITDMGSITLKKFNYEIAAKKVLVTLKKETGEISKYNALINEKTGAILKTWNRPRFENNSSTELKAQGQELPSIEEY